MEDWKTLSLVGGVLLLLTIATIVGQFLKRFPDAGLNAAAVRTFNLRLRAWWMMCALLATARFIGEGLSVAMFGFISFVALREFITITPTRLGDHRALFWAFILFTPLQYVLVAAQPMTEQSAPWSAVFRPLQNLLIWMNTNQFYNVLIPVYAFLFVPARVALSGDFKRYLERVAKIQAGLAHTSGQYLGTKRSYGVLFGLVQRQATMLSYVDVFQLLAFIFLAMIPLVMIMKRPQHGLKPAPGGH